MGRERRVRSGQAVIRNPGEEFLGHHAVGPPVVGGQDPDGLGHWLPVSVTLYLRQVTTDNEPLATGRLNDAAVRVTGGGGVVGSRLFKGA